MQHFQLVSHPHMQQVHSTKTVADIYTRHHPSAIFQETMTQRGLNNGFKSISYTKLIFIKTEIFIFNKHQQYEVFLVETFRCVYSKNVFTRLN